MTTRTIAVTLALLLAAGAAVSPVHAESAPPAEAVPTPDKPLTIADLEELREDLRSSRKQAIASMLTMTDVEATQFWPVYDQYAAERTRINDDQYALLVEYVNTFGKFDDAGALSFIKRWLDIDVKLAELRARYVPIVGGVLPGLKAATFFQIDRRLSEVVDLKLAAKIPLLQAQK